MAETVELVATYYYDPSVDYGKYNVFACYDTMQDYDDRKVSFYDVYDGDGYCANEGDPFYTMPSWQEIYEFYWLPIVRETTYNHDRDLTQLEKMDS